MLIKIQQKLAPIALILTGLLLVGIYNTASAAEIKKVQRGEITLTAANAKTEVAIEKVNPDKTFIICQNRAASLVFCELKDDKTLLISGGPATVVWQVVEFKRGVRVQRGTAKVKARYPFTTNVEINAVDTSRSFVILSEAGVYTSPYGYPNEVMPFTARLTGSTNLEIVMSPVSEPVNPLRFGPPPQIEIPWQVVEYDAVSVQRGITPETPLLARPLPKEIDERIFEGKKRLDIPISPIDTTKSFPLITFRTEGAIQEEARYMIMPVLDFDTLELHREDDVGNVIVSWEAVQLNDGAKVQKGTIDGTGKSEINIALEKKVDPDKSIVLVYSKGGYKVIDPILRFESWSRGVSGNLAWTGTLTSENNLQLKRASPPKGVSTVAWYVVTFPEKAGAPKPSAAPACTSAELDTIAEDIISDIKCDLVDEGVEEEITTSIVVDNPNDTQATDVQFILYVPDGTEPVAPLPNNSTWEAAKRILTIPLGDFGPKEEKEIELTFKQKPGTCTMYGILQGNIANGSFCERRGPVVTSIKAEKTIFQTVTNTINQTIGGAAGVVADLRNNDLINNLLRNIGVPLALTLGGVGGLSTAATALGASAPLAWNLLELLRFLMLGFLRFKKHKPWGLVLDELTGKPIAGAKVQIIDTEFQQVKETQITDQEGRFGFLVPPGSYYLRAAKSGYQKKETPVFNIKDKGGQVNLDISMSALSPAVSERKLQLRQTLRRIKEFLEFVTPYLLAFGTALSLFMAILFPTTLNIGVLALYILLDGFRIWLSLASVKAYGQVVDAESRRPLPLAVVRVFDDKRNWLLDTKVTGPDGRFKFLTMPGRYYITAEHSHYKPFHSPPIDLKKPGVISRDIELNPLQ